MNSIEWDVNLKTLLAIVIVYAAIILAAVAGAWREGTEEQRKTDRRDP